MLGITSHQGSANQTTGWHFTPTNNVKSEKKKENNQYWWAWGVMAISFTAGGSVKRCNHHKSWAAPQKAKRTVMLRPSNSAPRDMPKGDEYPFMQLSYARGCSTLVARAKRWKPKPPPTDECINTTARWQDTWPQKETKDWYTCQHGWTLKVCDVK